MLPFFRGLADRSRSLTGAAETVIRLANASGVTLSTAESLTGGMIGSALTSVPGSSRSFWGGCISYSPEAKKKLLGVPEIILERWGTVSKETAEAMALGALSISGTDISLAVTGVAGPAGGSDETPVGTVWVAIAWVAAKAREKDERIPEVLSKRFSFHGSRRRIRVDTALCALKLVATQLDR